MRNIKNTTRILIIAIICIQLSLSAMAAPISLLPSVEEYVFDWVETITNTDEECPWNITTNASAIIPLYDYNNSINGYIYNLSTNNCPSGYIHVFVGENGYELIAYTYEGEHYISDMLSEYKGNDVSATVLGAEKIIYGGGVSFFVKNGTTWYDLYQQQTLSSAEVAKVKTSYNKVEKAIVASSSFTPQTSTRATTTGQKKYVLNANNADIVITNDFEGRTINGVAVVNHCSPTAGTTIVKYWANRRGVTDLYYMSDWWVFSSLYVNMGTTATNGTHEDLIYVGLMSYGRNTRGVPPTGYDCWGNKSSEVPTFSKAKSYIDVNVPFFLCVQEGSVRHTNACFGYNTLNGVTQLIISNGWTRAWTFQSFTSFDISSYQYARWN